jgi:hypothetical protein
MEASLAQLLGDHLISDMGKYNNTKLKFSSTELEFVKLNPIAVLLVFQNRYSQSCIAIGFRRCYVINKGRDTIA